MITLWHRARHSLGVKLVLGCLAVEVVMLSILVITNISIMSASLADQMQTRVVEVETLLNAALAVPLVQRDNGALQDVLDSSRSERGIERLLLVDTRGIVMARSGWPDDMAPPPPPAAPTSPLLDDRDQWEITRPITVGGQSYGRLHMGISTRFFHDARSTMLRSSIAIALAEVALSTLLLAVIGFLLTRRLRAVAATSEAIANGDLSARARVSGGDDEVKRLADSFNLMAETLDRRVRDLATLSEAVEQSPVSVVITDTDGVIQYVNPHCCTASGYHAAEVIGQTPRIFKSGTTSAEDYQKLWATITSGTVWRGNFRTRRKDGSLFWEEAAIAPVTDAAGRIAQYVSVKLDVTESRQREEDLRRAVDHLTVANEELQRFAYVASHDLQEPLRTVVSFSQLLERRFSGQLGHDGDDYIRLVVGAGKRMHELINDLLVYSRSGQSNRSPERVSADTACRAAMENLHEAIARSSAAIVIDELPDVVAEEFQVVQLFQNLLGNAIKFCRQDVAPQILVTAHRDENMWIFAVTDNGIGFDPSAQDVFEIFRRLHPSHIYPGTGIGLAICKRIVQRYGGRIWASSRPGAGSTFLFSLPAAD